MKKAITSIIVLICIGVIIAISFIPKEKENKLKKVKVAEVTHSIFYAPMYVSHSLGYFEDEGLDVDIILTSGADAVAAAVLSGDVEIGFCGSEQSIYIYNGEEKDYLVNFAGLTKKDGSFIVSRDNKKFELTDLIGKTILGGRQGGMPAMTLTYTLHENNIDLDKVNIDTSVAFASMTGAFISGTGDYVTVFEPNGLQLEKQNQGHVVASVGELGGEVPYTVYNAKKSYIKNNPEVIEGFTKAIQKGIDYTYSHSPEEIAEVIGEYFPDNSKNELIEVIKRYTEIDSWYETTYITEEGFDRIQNIMKFNKVIDKEAPYDKLVNNSYSTKK